MQLDLDNKPVTELVRLQRLRYQYYKQFVEDITKYSIYMNQKVENYKQTVKELDTEIEKEKRKAKHK